MKMICLVTLVFILTTVACNSSKTIHSWKADKTVSKKYTRILVLGLMNDEDNSIREKMETQLAEDLKKTGKDAVASMEVLGIKVFDRMDEEDALYQLNNNCVDAVLTITLLNRKKEQNYIPGIVHSSPFNYYYDHFWRYRTTMNHRVKETAYYDTSGSYFLECNLYDMITQKLVYSIQSAPFSISGDEYPGKKFAGKIVTDFLKYSL